MRHLIRPQLFKAHPKQPLCDFSAFADLMNADEGEIIGLSLDVCNYAGVPCAVSAPMFILSGGSACEPRVTNATNYVRSGNHGDVLEAALLAPTLIQDLSQVIEFNDLKWTPSDTEGVHMRSFWMFRNVAVLMHNIHSVYIDDEDDLEHLALFFADSTSSNHEKMTRLTELDYLARIISSVAAPSTHDCWPEDIDSSSLHWQRFTPDQLA